MRMLNKAGEHAAATQIAAIQLQASDLGGGVDVQASRMPAMPWLAEAVVLSSVEHAHLQCHGTKKKTKKKKKKKKKGCV